jgi:hypothetical protein
MDETKPTKEIPESPEEPTHSSSTEETSTETTSTEEVAPEYSRGSWVRQVFVDAQGQKKIAITFVPDNPEDAAEREIDDYDDEDTADWEEFLGDPQGIDIDEGVAILRLDSTAEIATVTWIPNNEGDGILQNTLKQTPEEPGDPTANLREFRNCYFAQGAMSTVQKFRSCSHHLH